MIINMKDRDKMYPWMVSFKDEGFELRTQLAWFNPEDETYTYSYALYYKRSLVVRAVDDFTAPAENGYRNTSITSPMNTLRLLHKLATDKHLPPEIVAPLVDVALNFLQEVKTMRNLAKQMEENV